MISQVMRKIYIILGNRNCHKLLHESVNLPLIYSPESLGRPYYLIYTDIITKYNKTRTC